MFALALVVAMTMFVCCKTEGLRSDQVVGVWRIEENDRVGLKPAATTLTLDSSGKFAASALPPGFLQLEDVKPDEAPSGTRTWSLTRNDSEREERMRLTFTRVEGSKGRDLPYGAELFIQNSSAEARLYYFEGDPDDSRRIVFRRDPARR